MTVRSTLVACVGWVLLGPSCAWGQHSGIWIYRPLIRYVEGKVLLDGHDDALTADKSFLFNGQVLGTADGRVQLALGGAFLAETTAFLAENSSLKILSGQLPDQTFEILSGSAIIEGSKGAGSGLFVRYSGLFIRYKEMTIDLSKSGEYRIDADLGRVLVYRGEATVSYGVRVECKDTGCWRVVGHGPTGSVQVRKGEQVSLNQALPVSPFDTKDTDAFHTWVRRRVTPR